MTSLCSGYARDSVGTLSVVASASRNIAFCRQFAVRADVAQLVEHFTRNEGVGGSSPPVGSTGSPCNRPVSVVRRFGQAAALAPLPGPERGSSRVHARRFGGGQVSRCAVFTGRGR